MLSVGSLLPVSGLDLASVEQLISLKIVVSIPLRKLGSDIGIDAVVTNPLEVKVVP